MIQHSIEDVARRNRINASHLKHIYNRPIVIRCEHCGSQTSPVIEIPEPLITAAMEAFNLGANFLLSNNRQKRLVFARMAVSWHLMAHYGWTYREVAQGFMKDRATIYHYLACHHNRLKDDDRYIAGYNRFNELLSVDKSTSV